MNERYSRQILFNEIGKAGQEKLLNSRILLVGCGALGASHAEMLARAGIGRIRIVQKPVRQERPQRPKLRELNADERTRIKGVVSGIEDDGLRESLERLGASVRASKKP